MTALRALVVDDERIARSNLTCAIEAHARWSVVAEAETGVTALERARAEAPDVIFLDVQMPGMDGLEAARALDAMGSKALVVFVTAYDQYAIEAFELSAVDYLLKPFDDARLHRTLERLEGLAAAGVPSPVQDALDHIENPQRSITRLLIRSVGSIRVLPMEDVVWLSASGNYVEVHHAGGTDLHRIQLSVLEARLPHGDFCRVHRSAVVRLSEVRQIRTLDKGWTLALMSDGREVRVSHRHRDALIEALDA